MFSFRGRRSSVCTEVRESLAFSTRVTEKELYTLSWLGDITIYLRGNGRRWRKLSLEGASRNRRHKCNNFPLAVQAHPSTRKQMTKAKVVSTIIFSFLLLSFSPKKKRKKMWGNLILTGHREYRIMLIFLFRLTWKRRMSLGFPAFFKQFWLHFRKNLRKNLSIE